MQRRAILLLSLLLAAAWILLLAGAEHGAPSGTRLEHLAGTDWTNLSGGGCGNATPRTGWGFCRFVFAVLRQAMGRALRAESRLSAFVALRHEPSPMGPTSCAAPAPQNAVRRAARPTGRRRAGTPGAYREHARLAPEHPARRRGRPALREPPPRRSAAHSATSRARRGVRATCAASSRRPRRARKIASTAAGCVLPSASASDRRAASTACSRCWAAHKKPARVRCATRKSGSISSARCKRNVYSGVVH